MTCKTCEKRKTLTDWTPVLSFSDIPHEQFPVFVDFTISQVGFSGIC
jgi:hypothetical protein